MEISEDKLQELNESHYIRGQRTLLLMQLKEILTQLGYVEGDVDFSKEHLIAEREETVLALRSICEENGDNDWDEDLHLADVVNNHLGKYLGAG